MFVKLYPNLKPRATVFDMKAIVLGATGLVGTQLLELLSMDSNFSKALCPVRRTPERLIHKMQTNRLHENSLKNNQFTDKYKVELLKDLALFDPKDTVVICCLGTTIKKAKSKSAFRAVDHDLVLEFAKFFANWGAKQFMIVSASGANNKSSFFYNQVKGETEDALSLLGFQKLVILRPSLLLGKRQEFRLGEKLMGLLSPLFSVLLIGSLKKYKPIQARQVAKALQVSALHFAGIKNHPGLHSEKSTPVVTLENDELLNL